MRPYLVLMVRAAAACTGRERYLGGGPPAVLAIPSGTVGWEGDYTELALTRPDGKQLSLRLAQGGA